MLLSELTRYVPGARLVGADCEITQMEIDSRKAGPGTLFICISGVKVDRHDFAPQAEAAGAAALVVERLLEGITIPQVLVEDARAAWT